MWLLLLVLLMIVLSVMFGGFQKGTKDNGLGYRANVITAVAATGEAVAATGEAVAATGEAAGSARGTSG
jgi:type IV secretory pathway TrbL component